MKIILTAGGLSLTGSASFSADSAVLPGREIVMSNG